MLYFFVFCLFYAKKRFLFWRLKSDAFSVWLQFSKIESVSLAALIHVQWFLSSLIRRHLYPAVESETGPLASQITFPTIQNILFGLFAECFRGINPAGVDDTAALRFALHMR